MRLQNIIMVFGVGLALQVNAQTNNFGMASNPYASIAERNVFGLNSFEPKVAGQPDCHPPKIELDGIMSIFGKPQVLIKVGDAGRPGQMLKVKFYVLSENVRQDDLEVLHIDEHTGRVVFNNHGIVQELSLANASPVTTVETPPASQETSIPKSYPPEFVRSRTPDYLGGGTKAAQNGEPFQPMTPEERIVMIEAQRAYYKSHNDPRADSLPPTALTPSE